MNDFSSLGERIKYGLEKSGRTQADLSRYTGIKTATVSQWCNDRVKALKSDNAIRVAKFLNVNYNWLITGKGDPHGEPVLSLPDDCNPLEGYVQIREYEIMCGAGSGTEPTFEETHKSIPATYRESFFIDLGVNPDKCIRLKVHGDSMEPTLFDGDCILVNTADNLHIENNHVYAINVGNEVRVKRLIRMLNGDLAIHSDNQAYPTEILRHNDESIVFSIIGRVIEKVSHKGL